MVTYSLFVNGAFQSKSDNYDWMFQRGLAVAMYLGISNNWFNSDRTTGIIDRWKTEDKLILIVKS